MNRFLMAALLLIGFWMPQALALSPEEVEKYMNEIRPDLAVESVKESPVTGFYQMTLRTGHVLYISEDATHMFAGDLYQITPVALVNLTEAAKSEKRKRMLDALDETEMLVFAPPKDELKATVTIFTDIDCGYCRKLHQEVPELNELGIAVRYLAYPRAGPNSASFFKAVSAWCADNPNQALTQAKAGQAIPQKNCDNPVAKQYQLGNEMGVTGTPAVFYEDGTLQPGYVPAKQLAQRLGIL